MSGSAALATEQPDGPDFSCKLVHRATMYDTLKTLPAPFRAQVDHALGPMADRGGAFNPTDVMQKGFQSRRFIRAGEINDGRRFAWYEQGGIAYWKQIVLFERSGKKIESRAGWSSDLCQDTDKLLDGAKPVR